jgi:hypothetical protein
MNNIIFICEKCKEEFYNREWQFKNLRFIDGLEVIYCDSCIKSLEEKEK